MINTTSDKYATAFGFTEEEVFAAIDMTGFGGEKQHVKEWYKMALHLAGIQIFTTHGPLRPLSII